MSQYVAAHERGPRGQLSLNAGINAAEGDLFVGIEGDHFPVIERQFSRAAFLAAVTSELNVRIVPADAIVIERSELPAVRIQDGMFSVGGMLTGTRDETAETAMDAVREWLAIAEHLTANPPVDEAQVEAVARALAESRSGTWSLYTEEARRLYADGVRVVTS